MSGEPWICPACTLRQPKAGLCIFCGAPSPEATTDETPYYATLDTGESINRDVLRKRRQFITSKVRAEFPNLNEEGFDADIIRNARKRVRQFVFGETSHTQLNSSEKSILLQDCFDDLFGYGPLGPLIRDPEMREIKVFSKDSIQVRKKNTDFEQSNAEFDDEKQLFRLIENISQRSFPAWKVAEPEHADHYVTWDGIKIAVTHHPVPRGTPSMTLVFQDPLGQQDSDSDAGASNFRPLENHGLIRQKRQFICSHIRKEMPKWSTEPVEKVRKKIRQLVFGDSSGSRLTPYEKTVLYQDCLDDLFGFGPLGPLMRDVEVSEIRVYSKEKTTIKRHGLFATIAVMFDDDAHLKRIVNVLLGPSQPRDSEDPNTEEYITPTGSRIAVRRTASGADEPYLVINYEGRRF